jgi:hypothetical protein
MEGELLGGHTTDPESQMVRCTCPDCTAQPNPAHSIYSLAEWFVHGGLPADSDISHVGVVQEGAEGTVPLPTWLTAAAEHLGGASLVGTTIHVYYYAMVSMCQVVLNGSCAAA